MKIAAAACIFLMASSSAFAQRTAPYFAFHNNFWVNLHQTLFHEANLRKLSPAERSRFDPAPLPEAPLSSSERKTWNHAVGYYSGNFAGRSLLFDDGMVAISSALITSDDDGSHLLGVAGLSPELVEVLNQAAPIYRKYWWAAHKKSNQQWMESNQPQVKQMAGAIVPRLERSFNATWPSAPLRVDISFFVDEIGHAYTTDHTTLSSSTAALQGLDGEETVFHEGSHMLMDRLQPALDKECVAQKKACDGLWHAVLFYTVGAVFQEEVRKRNGADYVPYAYQYGVYQRGRWRAYIKAIEKDWPPYLAGAKSFPDAVQALVRDLS